MEINMEIMYVYWAVVPQLSAHHYAVHRFIISIII